MSSLNPAIEELISQATGQPFSIAGVSGVGGGCIHNASTISGTDGRRFFVKQNSRDHLPAFEAEVHGLEAMAATGTIRVPLPIGTCEAGSEAALVLEHLPMGGRRGGDSSAMGKQLAQLHRCSAKTFGWPHDNWIGSTPQINHEHSDWIRFYTESRLIPQISWARNRGLRLKKAKALLGCVPAFFVDYAPPPSLLHGDLWGGNAGFLDDGSPVIFDPACYFGDREADLAMTEMFGGFSNEFYATYNVEWPLDPGYPMRKPLYTLYHILNHYNLFGGGYGMQAEATIDQLIDSVT